MRPVPVRREPGVRGLEREDGVPQERFAAGVPRGRVGVGELLRHQAGGVDAHVHDHVDRRGQGEGRAGGGPVGEAVRARGDRGAELSDAAATPRPSRVDPWVTSTARPSSTPAW